MKHILLSLFTSFFEPLKVTKTKLLFDIQSSNVFKIVFLSICLFIIVTAVIVLMIKIKKTEKKKGNKK